MKQNFYPGVVVVLVKNNETRMGERVKEKYETLEKAG